MRAALIARLSVASICAAAIAATVIAPQQAFAATAVKKADSISVKNQVLIQAKAAINAMAAKNSASDTQVFSGGRFRYAGLNCPRCELGPAVAAAALYRRTGDRTFSKLATTAMDTAIRTQQQPNGSFTTGNAAENGGNTIQTVFFAEHLGAMLYYFGPTLDAAHRATYKAALAKAADAMIAQDLLTYYINGNINLAATVAFGAAAAQTGRAKYRNAYETSMAFTIHPKGARWAKYGLKVTKPGKAAYGRDTAAFLAEKGTDAGAGTGFDPEYGQFQADIASAGYTILGDKRLLTLSNQLNNSLSRLVRTHDWSFDISHGTRHNRPAGARDRYTTPALYVAAVSTKTNTTAALSQVSATTDLMRVSAVVAWPGIYQMWGTGFATLIYSIK